MNYVQINIGGKDRGLKFNRVSMEIYTKNIDMKKPYTSSIYATFYAGLSANCYVKQVDEDFTFEDVVDWVDELYENGKGEEIKSVCTTWEETSVYKDWLKSFQQKVANIEREVTTSQKKEVETTPDALKGLKKNIGKPNKNFKI